MTWYKTGTVNVTNGSATVTGIGTSFIANAKVGEALRVGSGGDLYEITGVVSDTELTVSPAYLGSTNTGQTYVIVPVRGVLAEARAALSSAVTTMQGHTDGALAGRFGAGGAAAPAISFAADPNTGFFNPSADQIAAATNGIQRLLLSGSALQLDVPLTGTAAQSSVNDTTTGRLMKTGAFGLGLDSAVPTSDLDSTVITGLYRYGGSDAARPNTSAQAGVFTVQRVSATGVLQVAMHETTGTRYRRFSLDDGTTWSDWQMIFDQANVLGAVAQSGGVPTGALIEAGSNANGYYRRFADGTQICTQDLTSGSSKAVGDGSYANPWRTADFTWTYPASFIAAPAVSGTVSADDNGAARHHAFTARYINATSLSGANMVRLTGGTIDLTPSVALMAIGRWF